MRMEHRNTACFFPIFPLWFVTVWMWIFASFITLKHVPPLNTNSLPFNWICSGGTFHQMECVQLLSQPSSCLCRTIKLHTQTSLFFLIDQMRGWLVCAFISIEHHLNNIMNILRTYTTRIDVKSNPTKFKLLIPKHRKWISYSQLNSPF